MRGACFGLGSGLLFGWRFGLSFGAMSTIAQIIAYRMGITPAPSLGTAQTMAQTSARRGQSHDRLRAGRSWRARRRRGNYSRTALLFAVGVGVALGVNSTLIGVIGPIIERWADRLPERRLGVFGTLLILCGFLLESVEHWLVLLRRSIR